MKILKDNEGIIKCKWIRIKFLKVNITFQSAKLFRYSCFVTEKLTLYSGKLF